jgi:hypothetical protein
LVRAAFLRAQIFGLGPAKPAGSKLPTRARAGLFCRVESLLKLFDFNSLSLISVLARRLRMSV